MRFSIRWKLIVWIGLPAITIFVIIQGLNLVRLMNQSLEQIKDRLMLQAGFAQMLERLGNTQPVETLCDQIIAEVDTHCQHQRGDDITLLIVHRC